MQIDWCRERLLVSWGDGEVLFPDPSMQHNHVVLFLANVPWIIQPPLPQVSDLLEKAAQDSSGRRNEREAYRDAEI